MKSLVPLLKESLQHPKRKSTVAVDLPDGVRLDRKTGDFVLPKQPAVLADMLYAVREQRLERQRAIEQLEKLESKIREWFIENLPKSQTSGIAGKFARVQIEIKPVPQVKDWPGIYAYIKKHGAFELLQKRLAEGAVKERLEAGEKMDFIEIFQAKKVSVTKL
jgi:hypothetical protein